MSTAIVKLKHLLSIGIFYFIPVLPYLSYVYAMCGTFAFTRKVKCYALKRFISSFHILVCDIFSSLDAILYSF